MRNTLDLKIPGVRSEKVGERDNGKIFRLTEMSAFAGEKWAARMILALMKSGVDLPEGFEKMGMAGLASISMRAFGGIAPEVLLPLMDEMLSCVKCIPDPRHPDESARPLVEEDIEEIKTLLKIREKLLEVHLGFSLAEKLSIFKASAAALLKISPTTSTSTPSSESSLVEG
jgi:hypothetical protein